ncbi:MULTISPECIES: hypothetical protein [Marinobacter]|uniref:SHOCT domain-containing protein n=1 Tax=Marinobacter suaedae TaxID=3057675 RepID=A0ABT8VYD1_9GAMM|nr:MULTISPECIES: hypothetical protein [unclassified Marinobacter]MBZ2169069.1 hypothetical protein [Marinobacter sp. F4216]MDO3720938.1 hypothetical protein [Marinobacter sp. chi1]
MNVATEQADTINLDSLNLPSFDLQRQGWEIPPREEWRVEGKFRQTFLRKKTSTLFRRFNGHYLAITTHRRKKELPETVLDLTFVEPQPREVKNYQLKLWFAAACLLTIPAAIYSLVPSSPVWLLAPVVLALVLMLLAWRWRNHYFEFTALNSDVVLFRVDALTNDEAHVTAFVDALCKGILRGQNQLPEGKGRIPLAVAEMRRLSREGLISHDDYEAIKQRWFRL